MSIKDDINRARDRALSDNDGVISDTSEAVDFTIDIVKRYAKGNENVLAEAALEIDGYVSQAVAIVNMMKKWQTHEKELLKSIGEDNEGLMNVLPTFIMARTLQNFDKRHRDGK